MSEWKEKEIGDLAFSYAGGTPSRAKSEYFGGTIPWISSSEVNQSSITETTEKITEKGLKYSSAKWVPADSVLIAMYGATAGQVAYLKIRATTNQAVLALIPRDSSIDSKFLYYEVDFNRNKILYHAQGSGQPNLNKQIVDRTRLLVPNSHAVQRKIARILSTIDGQIEKTEAIIAKYQAVKQGMLQDLFTRGIDVRTGQLRPRYEEAPELYQESALGMIPKEWEVVELQSTVASPIVYGILMPGYGFSGGIPVVKVKNIYNEGIDTSELLLTSPAIAKQYSRSSLMKGDLLFTIRGTVGRCAFVPEALEGSNITQDTARIRITGMNPLFIRYSFHMPEIKKYIELNTLGLAVKGINLKELRMLSIPKPSFEESNMIAQKIKGLDILIDTESQTLSKLQVLKQGMMQDLLSGKVEVTAQIL